MKLRLLRKYEYKLKPGEIPIYGPGSKNQCYRASIDTLQFYDTKKKRWTNVPIVDEISVVKEKK